MADLYPMAVLYGFLSEQGSLKFVGRREMIEVSGYVSELQKILGHCNGSASLSDIRAKLPEIGDETFYGLLDFCLKEGIVADSRQLSKQFHLDSENPPVFGYDLGLEDVRRLMKQSRKVLPGFVIGRFSLDCLPDSLKEMAAARKSCRAFSKRPVKLETILSLLGFIYSVSGPRTTPSAGGLYPMRIFLACSDESQELDQFLHEFDPVSGSLVRSAVPVGREQLSRCLDTASAVNGIVIFVACDLSRVLAKYANRGYRLALIEAGHVAQNAYLFAADQGLGVLEFSGYHDQVVAEFLGLNYPNEAVLTTLVVGHEDPATEAQFTTSNAYILHDLKKELVGPEPDKPIEWVKLSQFGRPPYEMSKNVAVALQKGRRHSKGKFGKLQLSSTGISTSSSLAQLKALVEAYERHSSGNIRVDFVGAAVELSSRQREFVDPREFTPYTDAQFENRLMRLTPFDPDAIREWVEGKRHLSVEPVYVPIELAFYPVPVQGFGRRLCYEASSNGVAAHTSYETALKNAFLELVERDAVMVTWYAQRSVEAIIPASLGIDALLRTERWRKLGWESKLLDITVDSVPVCLAILYSPRKYPHVVAGSSAGSSFSLAASKALDEAESMLTSWRTMRHTKIRPEDVRSPLDHGLLYYRKENMAHLEWLLEAKEVPVRSPLTNTEEALAKFNPIVVELAAATDRVPLFVVRALSEKLLPANFGFGTEHVDHPRLKMLGLEWKRKYPAHPHILA